MIKEILDFLMTNWQLSGLMVLVIGAYLMFEFMQQMTSGNSVSPDEAVAMINHQNAVVFDVRTSEEYATGHILGAVHIDTTESDAKLKHLNKYSQKPVIVVCAHGKRSALFLKRLQSLGFAEAVNLTGGLHAWQNAGLPLTTAGSSKHKVKP
jgi:rhodanese-related sulfurtransferase